MVQILWLLLFRSSSPWRLGLGVEYSGSENAIYPLAFNPHCIVKHTCLASSSCDLRHPNDISYYQFLRVHVWKLFFKYGLVHWSEYYTLPFWWAPISGSRSRLTNDVNCWFGSDCGRNLLLDQLRHPKQMPHHAEEFRLPDDVFHFSSVGQIDETTKQWPTVASGFPVLFCVGPNQGGGETDA